jgi:hypothetical protein
MIRPTEIQCFLGNPMKNETKNHTIWAIMSYFENFHWKTILKISNQTNFDALTHKCLWIDTQVKCLWFHTQFSNIAPASSISISSKQGFTMLKCVMIQNATKFCIWGAHILKTLSLSLTIKKREKIKSPTKPPQPKSPWLWKWCLWSYIYITSFIPYPRSQGFKNWGEKILQRSGPRGF